MPTDVATPRNSDEVPPRASDLFMNTVHVTGLLIQDPETRELSDGTRVCDLRLAVDRMGHDDKPGFIDVATFGRTARSCASVLKEGWLVAVAGQLEYRERTTSGGHTAASHSVIGDIVSPLRFRKAPAGQAA